MFCKKIVKYLIFPLNPYFEMKLLIEVEIFRKCSKSEFATYPILLLSIARNASNKLKSGYFANWILSISSLASLSIMYIRISPIKDAGSDSCFFDIFRERLSDLFYFLADFLSEDF